MKPGQTDAKDVPSWDDLPIETARRIEAICTDFEAGTETGSAAIEARLNGFTGKARAALLRELVWLDIELRGRRGESTSETDYGSFALAEDRRTARSVYRDYGATYETELELQPSSSRARSDAARLKGNSLLADRYRIEQEVGRGGLGVIYRAFDTRTNRPLAIKSLRESTLSDGQADQRLLREAILTGMLQHPGIPPVYDHGYLPSGLPFFSMKLVEGETLESILVGRASESDELSRCIAVFQQVAQTMAYAHNHSIIHRDLKPQNIMVGKFGEVQVIDWGLAKQLGPAQTGSIDDTVEHKQSAVDTATILARADVANNSAHSGTPDLPDLTLAGDILGTPSSMSPEQARGQVAEQDARTDVFGLGTILYQILTNRRLYDGDSTQDAVSRSARGDFESAMKYLDARDAPHELVDLCRRCLAPVPDQRPASAEAIAEVTTGYLTSLQERLQQAEIQSVRHEEKRRRQRLFGTMAGALAIASIGGLVAVTWQWRLAAEARGQEAEARVLALQEAATTEEVNEFLTDILASARPDEEGVAVTVHEVMDAMLPRLDERFKDKPSVEGRIRLAFGVTYRSLGMKDVALEQVRLAVAAFEKAQPFDELELLLAQDRMAGLLRSRDLGDDLEEAYRLRKHVLDRHIELLGEADAETMVSYNNLGTVLIEQRKYSEARQVLQRSLELAILNGESESLGADQTRYNLATIAWHEGDFATAENVLNELILRYRDDPAGISLYLELPSCLGQVYEEQGKYEASQTAFQEALRSRTEDLGADHANTLSAMRKLTRLLVKMEKFEAAFTLLEECLELHNEHIGPAAGLTFSVREYVPRALAGLNRNDEAEKFLRETSELLRSERGAKHRYTLAAEKQLKQFLDGLSAGPKR